VIATRSPAGDGTRIVEQLTEESILNDSCASRGVAHEHRRPRPTNGETTEINERGRR